MNDVQTAKMKTRSHITCILAPTLLFFLCSNVVAQDKTDQITDSIITIGIELYRSEMASWYGTDIFLERFKEQRQNIVQSEFCGANCSLLEKNEQKSKPGLY